MKLETYADRQKFDFSDINGFYVVKSGHVKIGVKSSSVRCFAIAGPSEIIGGIHVHGVDYTVTSIGDVQVCYIDRTFYPKLAELDPELFREICMALARTEYCRQKHIHVLSKRSVRERISGILLLLSEKMNSNKSSLRVTIDKTTIADLANTTIETLSRMLTDLEEEAVVKRIATEIEILNPEKLKSYFNN